MCYLVRRFCGMRREGRRSPTDEKCTSSAYTLRRFSASCRRHVHRGSRAKTARCYRVRLVNMIAVGKDASSDFKWGSRAQRKMPPGTAFVAGCAKAEKGTDSAGRTAAPAAKCSNCRRAIFMAPSSHFDEAASSACRLRGTGAPATRLKISDLCCLFLGNCASRSPAVRTLGEITCDIEDFSVRTSAFRPAGSCPQ